MKAHFLYLESRLEVRPLQVCQIATAIMNGSFSAKLYVRVVQYISSGTDYYQYPSVPHITAVYSDGCQISEKSIYNCATKGGVTLNITGTQLNSPMVVMVAQTDCSSVILDPTGTGTWLTCRMGAGTGYNQSIVVAQNVLYRFVCLEYSSVLYVVSTTVI